MKGRKGHPRLPENPIPLETNRPTFMKPSKDVNIWSFDNGLANFYANKTERFGKKFGMSGKANEGLHEDPLQKVFQRWVDAKNLQENKFGKRSNRREPAYPL
jgi:hypothetical protein